MKEIIKEELKESIYWNVCDGNAGYKLISTCNVELLIDKAIDRAKEEEIKRAKEIIENMGKLDIYYNKEMAIKTLDLFDRLFDGELIIKNDVVVGQK